MKILKVHPKKFDLPTGVVYWARKITNEEKNEHYVEPTHEEYKTVMRYWDPMTGIPADCTYTQYKNLTREMHTRKMQSLISCTYTIEKSIVLRRNWDTDIALIEQKPEFEGFLHSDG